MNDKLAEDNNINRWIAEKVMGLCWHEYPDPYWNLCGKCKTAGNNPDYSSPDSPRSLLDGVEKVAIERFGEFAYVKMLAGACELLASFSFPEIATIATASPDVRCRAIKSLYEQGEKE